MDVRNPIDQASTGAIIPVASRVGGTAVTLCGDSITVGAGTVPGSGTDYATRLRAYLGGLLSIARTVNAGVTGNTSAQLLARMDAIIAAKPEVLFVLIGTNDVGVGVPLATYQANIAAIKAKADAAGLPILFGEIPPRGNDSDTTAQMVKDINRFNVWLRFWCAAEGVPLAPLHRRLVDPATGYMAASYWTSPDETHPNAAGHDVIAQAVSTALRPLLPTPTWPVVTKGAGLMPRPLMDTFADWGNYAGPQFPDRSVVASANGDLPAGQWTRFTLTNGASAGAGTMGAQVPTSGWTAGDRLLFMAWVRCSAAGVLGKVQAMDGNQVAKVIGLDQPAGVGPYPVIFDYQVPTTGTPAELHWGIRIQSRAGATDTVDIGAADVFNLTAMGLTDLKI